MNLYYTHKPWDEPNSLIVKLNSGELVNLPASCNVRNEINGRRKDSQVIRSMPDSFPVQPRRMPVGLWNIGMPQRRSQADRAPYFIPCDAIQELPVWLLDEHGYYEAPLAKKVIDKGYGLHCSNWETTLGCIKFLVSLQLLMLVNLIFAEKTAEKQILLEVSE
jgi:hypothetical protein